MIKFEALDEIYQRIEQLSESRFWLMANDVSTRNEIIRMNTDDQLYDKGIDSIGANLGEYTPNTKRIKELKGQRFDHITLKDRGLFYDSWIVKVDERAINLDADDVADYDRPLFTVYGEDVLGLTDENMLKLKQMILFNYLINVNVEILR